MTMLSGVAAMYSATSSHCTVPKPPTKYTSEIRFIRKHTVFPDSHRSLLSLLCFWAKICKKMRQLWATGLLCKEELLFALEHALSCSLRY